MKKKEIIAFFVYYVILITCILIFKINLSFILIFVLILLPFSLKSYLTYYRINSKEKNFSIFVRDFTLNIKTGMEPVKAITLLKNNDYGALSGDIKLLASNLSIGLSMDQALKTMSDNNKSIRIKRAISIISGAIKSGGNIEDPLTILSTYLINERDMKSEIDSKLFTYEIIFFIIFLLFIAMNYFLLNNILPLMNKSGFSVDMNFYRTLMFRTTILLGIFMGITGAKLTKGTIMAGFPNVIVFLAITYVSYNTIL